MTARDETDIAREVSRAAGLGQTIRPMGAAHSSSPLFATSDVLLVDQIRGLTEIRSGDGVAVLGPGTNLGAAGEELLGAGMAMGNLGDVSYQTLAGAIGTGTHGTGALLGNLSTMLVGGRLVTASGDVLPFGTEANEPDADLVRALRVSLGALGVFSSVTIRVEPAVELRRRNWITRIDWVLDHFAELVAAHRHVDFYWYPRSDQAQLRVVDPVGEADDPGLPANARLKTDRRGPPHRVIPNDRELRFEEMEYMLPLEGGVEMFRQVRDRIKARHRAQVGWRVLVRTVQGDDSMLSPAAGRPTMTIALLQNNTLPYRDYFDDMEPVLRSFGGRPHWGKKHSMTYRELSGLYPEWDAFQRIRRDLDPHGVFLNEHLTELLGAADPPERGGRDGPTGRRREHGAATRKHDLGVHGGQDSGAQHRRRT